VSSFEKRVEALLTRIAVALERIADASNQPPEQAKFDSDADIDSRLGR